MIAFKLRVIWFDGCVETREFNNALAGIKKPLLGALRGPVPKQERPDKGTARAPAYHSPG
jgi:hypothetical protein